MPSDDRRQRVREVHHHDAGQLDEVPPFLSTRLLRDALLVPHTDPYRVVSEELEDIAAPAG